MYRCEIVTVLVVFVCVVNCAKLDRNNNDTERNCDLVRPFFEMNNITLQTTDKTYGKYFLILSCPHFTRLFLSLSIVSVIRTIHWLFRPHSCHVSFFYFQNKKGSK